jgi:thiamine monophosphate kinase
METSRRESPPARLDEEKIVNLFRRPPRDSTAVAVGIGDDTALVNLPSGRRLLFTTDLMADGQCERHRSHGRRAALRSPLDCPPARH